MEIVFTSSAPKAVGPYSQAVKSNGLLFCSGQIALTAEGEMISTGIEDEVIQVMKNLKAVLEASGSGFDKVLKSTIFLTNMDDFSVVNEVYGSFFKGEKKPARSTVAVKDLPKGAKVEIECIAEF